MIQICIDGRNVSATDGQTILEAASAVGTPIPTLCHHPDLSPVGSCRVCLVHAGGEHLVPACKTLAEAGQTIQTDTPHIREARRFVLELLLQNYRDDIDRTESGDSPWRCRCGTREIGPPRNSSSATRRQSMAGRPGNHDGRRLSVSRIAPQPDRWHPVEAYAKRITYSGVPTSEVGGDQESLRKGLVQVYFFSAS